MTNNEQIKILQRTADRIRTELNLSINDPFSFEKFEENHPKLTKIIIPLSVNIFGLINKMDTETSLIVINSNNSEGRMNFIYGHELYHYLFSNKGSCICKLDEKFYKSKNDEETMADIFSLLLLLPFESVRLFILEKCDGAINAKTIGKLSYHFKVDFKMALISLYIFKIINEEQLNRFLNLQPNDFSGDDVPLSFFESKLKTIEYSGYYEQLASKLLENGRISQNKYKSIITTLKGLEDNDR